MSLKSIFFSTSFITLAILAFFKPICIQYFSSLEMLESAFKGVKILIVAFILLYWLFATKIKNSILLSVALFELWLVSVTIYFDGYWQRAAIDLIAIVSWTILILHQVKYNQHKFLSIFKNTLTLYLLLQILSEILFPAGFNADLYHNIFNPLFFMTTDNGTSSLAILTLTVYTLYNRMCPMSKLVMSLPFFASLLSGSMTALLTTVLFYGMLYLSSFKSIKLFANYKTLIFLFGIILLSVFSANYISEYISQTTERVGYSGRDYLWAKSIKLFFESPIVGYGNLEHDYLKVWGGYYATHNYFLELMLMGGVVGLILWAIIIYQALIKSKKLPNEIKSALYCGLFCMLVALQMESFVNSVYLFSILALVSGYSCYYKNLSNGQR